MLGTLYKIAYLNLLTPWLRKQSPRTHDRCSSSIAELNTHCNHRAGDTLRLISLDELAETLKTFLLRVVTFFLLTLLKLLITSSRARFNASLIEPASIERPDTSLRSGGVTEAYSDDAVFLLVVEHDIGNLTVLHSFVAYVFFDVEDGAWVFGELFQCEHVFKNNDLVPAAGSVGQDLWVVVVPICEAAVASISETFVFESEDVVYALVHLLSLLDDLLAIAISGSTLRLGLVTLQRFGLLTLEACIGFSNTHRPGGDLLAESEVGLVEHVDGELHGLVAEVD